MKLEFYPQKHQPTQNMIANKHILYPTAVNSNYKDLA
jgi:hypothetical protein